MCHCGKRYHEMINNQRGKRPESLSWFVRNATVVTARPDTEELRLAVWICLLITRKHGNVTTINRFERGKIMCHRYGMYM